MNIPERIILGMVSVLVMGCGVGLVSAGIKMFWAVIERTFS